jgi:hypothetical protein
MDINIPEGCVLIRLDELKTLQKDMEEYKQLCVKQHGTIQYLREEQERHNAIFAAIRYIKEIVNQSVIECEVVEYKSWIDHIKDILDRYTRDSEVPHKESDVVEICAGYSVEKILEEAEWD